MCIFWETAIALLWLSGCSDAFNALLLTSNSKVLISELVKKALRISCLRVTHFILYTLLLILIWCANL